MPAGFGVNLSSNPSYPGGVEKHLTIDQVEELEPPRPEKEPRFERIKKQINLYLNHTPEVFKISLPICKVL